MEHLSKLREMLIVTLKSRVATSLLQRSLQRKLSVMGEHFQNDNTRYSIFT
jgi:plastocyanin domain-containing protein